MEKPVEKPESRENRSMRSRTRAQRRPRWMMPAVGVVQEVLVSVGGSKAGGGIRLRNVRYVGRSDGCRWVPLTY